MTIRMTNCITDLSPLLHALDEIQAQDIKVIDVSKQTSMTDYMIICSGRSSRHVQAIAQSILESLKAIGIKTVSNPYVGSPDWELLDFGDYIVHVMQPETRAFYNLEELWKDPQATD